MDSSNWIAIERCSTVEMDAGQRFVVYRSDAWFGKGEHVERERERSFSFFSMEKMKIEVEIPLKFWENLKFLAREKAWNLKQFKIIELSSLAVRRGRWTLWCSGNTLSPLSSPSMRNLVDYPLGSCLADIHDSMNFITEHEWPTLFRHLI